jgi:hypothetical protein
VATRHKKPKGRKNWLARRAHKQGRRLAYTTARRLLPRAVRSSLRRALSLRRRRKSPARRTMTGLRSIKAQSNATAGLSESSAESERAGVAKKLLITSIFAPSPWNREWHSLQSRYVAATTKDCAYDYELFLNGVAEKELDASAACLGTSRDPLDHPTALREVVDAFRQRDHDYYLILDSDCFPIFPGWFTVLTNQMERFGKQIAAPVRYENLDRLPHPCAFFLTREVLQDERINFDKGHPGSNLLGREVSDVGSAMLDLLPSILPLLRTNVVNPHPVAAALYHQLFYHHGAGSRGSRFRVLHKFHYYAHWWDADRDADVGELRDRLFEDPTSFIDYLRGVNHDWRSELSELSRRRGLGEITRRGLLR